MITINNTMPGVIKNIEVKGNTYQDPNNLSKIVSAGIPNGDGTFTYTVVSCGENLLDASKFTKGHYISVSGGLNPSADYSVSDYIRVDGVKSLTCSNLAFNANVNAFYDRNKVYIGSFTSHNNTVSIPSNAYYARVTVLNTDINYKLQEGTVSTPYTPYQETRCDIKLPCQLEKWDRLYFDKVENAWCIGKGCVTLSAEDLINKFVVVQNLTNTTRFSLNSQYHSQFKAKPASPIICNTIPFKEGNDDTIHGRVDGTIPYGAVTIWVDKTISSVSALNKYFIDNDVFLKFESLESKKIILPKDIQIQLNSFASKTHIYTISGDVDATVKATVSKSLASTVQANTEEINKINNTIADIQGLKESQDFAYETDKGYLVCKDTQTGVVKDLKIYGKSLVNAWNVSEWMKVNTQIVATDKTGTSVMQIPQKDNIFNAGDIVTVVADISVDNPTYCYWQVNYVSTTGEEKSLKNITFQSNIKSFVTQLPSDYSYMRCIFVGVQAGNTRTFKNNGCMCIKGDLSGRIPPYFEGIGSVGNGNEIEVLSRKEDGNLFNVNDFKRYVLGLGSGYSSYLVRDSRNCWHPTNYGVFHSKFMWDIRLDENVSYVIKFDYYFESSNQNKGLYFRVAYTDGSFEYPVWGEQNKWSTAKITTNPNKAIAYIHMTYGESTNKTWIDLDSIVIAKAKNYNDKLENKQDKKTILFKDADNSWKPLTELNGIDSNNCDMVDSTLNKYTKKYARYKFTGNETIDYITDYGDVSRFNVTNIPVYSKAQAKISCNRFNVGIISTPNIECINSHHEIKNIAIFQIKTNKLATKDREGFKKWLVENPTEMIIEMEVPKEYEINPIYPDSYENETMISFGSGVIAPHASWKIASHAANIIKNQGQRLTRLENDFYKYTVVQNRIMLDSRYAADSATFKVDTSIYNSNNTAASSLSASICAAKEIRQDVKYDFDLYKLIKRNILVGKDNYDRVWMEECMTFYWMDFKISDEMYSELNEIIENQYNPPVDMTPIEPPIGDVVEEIPQI